jgi:hypothetical protein
MKPRHACLVLHPPCTRCSVHRLSCHDCLSEARVASNSGIGLWTGERRAYMYVSKGTEQEETAMDAFG